MDAYTNALRRHLELGAAEAAGREVDTVFFGGGTPSLMGPERLTAVFETLRQHYAVKAGAEITLEANPESADEDLFRRLAPFGLNRVSLGAQSFHPAELASLGRVHGVDDIGRAVENARRAGIGNVSIDLIFGLPGQTMERWKVTVERAFEAGIDHLSAYALAFEEGTLLHRLLEKGRIAPALDETYAEMYDFLRDRAEKAGFEHYEISNWCAPGFECRHNLIYWDRWEYLAFGVSAHGFLADQYFSVIRDTGQYVQILGRLRPGSRSAYFHPALLDERRKITREAAASDAMIFGLRKTAGVRVDAFRERFGFAPEERWPEELETCGRRNLLERGGGSIRLKPGAYFICNEAMGYFLDS